MSNQFFEQDFDNDASSPFDSEFQGDFGDASGAAGAMDLASKFKSAIPINKSKKPKRNRSAFIIFSSEMRAQLKAQNKDMNSNEIMVKLADMWKNLDTETRAVYNDRAEKEKVKYLLELNEFYQTFPFEIIQNKTKRNHVKKPCSAYAIFLKDVKDGIKDENPDLKMADILKIVGERWKALPAPQKAAYKARAEEEKEAAKAKISEHMYNEVDETFKKMPLPQKRIQNQKRIQKALLKENISAEEVAAHHEQNIINTNMTKIEETLSTSSFSASSPYSTSVATAPRVTIAEEPVIRKTVKKFNPAPVVQQQAFAPEYNMWDSPNSTTNSSQSTPVANNTNNVNVQPMTVEEANFIKESSFLASLCQNDDFFAPNTNANAMVKKPSKKVASMSKNSSFNSNNNANNGDLILDLLNFHAKCEQRTSSKKVIAQPQPVMLSEQPNLISLKDMSFVSQKQQVQQQFSFTNNINTYENNNTNYNRAQTMNSALMGALNNNTNVNATQTSSSSSSSDNELNFDLFEAGCFENHLAESNTNNNNFGSLQAYMQSEGFNPLQ